jgi:hypothetical protein
MWSLTTCFSLQLSERVNAFPEAILYKPSKDLLVKSLDLNKDLRLLFWVSVAFGATAVSVSSEPFKPSNLSEIFDANIK